MIDIYWMFDNILNIFVMSNDTGSFTNRFVIVRDVGAYPQLIDSLKI